MAKSGKKLPVEGNAHYRHTIHTESPPTKRLSRLSGWDKQRRKSATLTKAKGGQNSVEDVNVKQLRNLLGNLPTDDLKALLIVGNNDISAAANAYFEGLQNVKAETPLWEKNSNTVSDMVDNKPPPTALTVAFSESERDMDSESSSTRRIQSIEMTSIENQITDDANDAGELETPMDMHENKLRGGFVAPLEVESASHLGETTQAGNCCYSRLANMKRKHLISFLVIAGVGFVMLVVMLPLSFSYVHFDQYGFLVNRYSGAIVSGKKALLPGRYYNGLRNRLIVFPRRSKFVFMNNTAFRTSEGLMLNVDIVLQYMLKRESLYDIYINYGTLSNINNTFSILTQHAAYDVGCKYSGTEILTKRQTVMAEMEHEIKTAIESKGFQVVKVHMLHIDSLNIDAMKSLTDSIMKSVGYQLEYRILKEKEKINTIEALTNRMVG